MDGHLTDVLLAVGGPRLGLRKGGVLNVGHKHGLHTGGFLQKHLDRVEQVAGFHLFDLKGHAKGSNPELAIKSGVHQSLLLITWAGR